MTIVTPDPGNSSVPDRIALISDVHGNVTALTAVLDDIRRRGIPTILNLGDVAGKGPRGSECVRLTREHCAVTIRGNWDDFMPKPATRPRHPAVEWWREELTSDDREWLLGLPLSHDLTLSGRRVRLVHASAESVYVRVFPHHSEPEFAAMFAATELTGPGPTPDVVCYGDIHYAYIRHRNGLTLLNAGSVGNSLDEPTASYVILDGELGSAAPAAFGVQFVRVPYDVEAEIAAATALGMPELDEYAAELRTAVYQR
ncbi:metallophosphoesterase family protein [Lysobacter korlensis]|uniref:Metallophosphoesterase family protein n=1 Tax=Lysobacter korlensis TaxID=553636 RepID=A0ABV6RXY6_9GAMM